jgi:hypothetical protein
MSPATVPIELGGVVLLKWGTKFAPITVQQFSFVGVSGGPGMGRSAYHPKKAIQQ